MTDQMTQLASALLLANKIIKEKDQLLEQLDEQLAEQQPKVDFYNLAVDPTDYTDFVQLSEALNIEGLESEKLLILLRESNIFDCNNIPYQYYVDLGFFRVIKSRHTRSDDSSLTIYKVITTQKGADYLFNKYKDIDVEDIDLTK